MRKNLQILIFLIPLIAILVSVVFIAGFGRQKTAVDNPGLSQLTNPTQVTTAAVVDDYPTWVSRWTSNCLSV